MNLVVFMFFLLIVTSVGLYYSIKESLQLEKRRILLHSQLLGLKTFGIAIRLLVSYDKWYHPMRWVGKLVMKINDLQMHFHAFLAKHL